MIIVYDKEGKQHFHHYIIDAKEAIASGNFFKNDPRKPVVEKPVEKKVITPGEDISDAKFINPAGFEVNQPEIPEEKKGLEKEVAPAPEFEEVGTTKKKRK